MLHGVTFKDGIKVTVDDNHDDGITEERVAARSFFIAKSTTLANCRLPAVRPPAPPLTNTSPSDETVSPASGSSFSSYMPKTDATPGFRQ